MRSFIYKLIYFYYFVLNLPKFLLHNVKYGRRLKIRGILFIQTAGKCEKNAIVIGDDTCINSSLSSNPIGGGTKTILNVRNKGHIIIGNRCGISNTAIVSDCMVCIGNDTNIGSGTIIYDTDFHPIGVEDRMRGYAGTKTKPVKIGDKVFIGGHCIILKGVTIGDGAVVGAGSVVTRDVPPYEIWAGNPAKFVRKISKNVLSAT